MRRADEAPRPRWGALLMMTGATLLLATAARADIVVHDGGVAKDKDAAARVEGKTGTAPTMVLSHDKLSGPSRLLVVGAKAERCGGEPVSLSVTAKLDEAAERVLSFELEKAQESLTVVQTLLPCQEAPVPARDLARLAFLGGAAAFDLGDAAGAEAAMRQAAAADPTYEGERGFPRDHVELLKAVREEVTGGRPARLWVWPGPGMAEVYLDGALLQHPGQDGASVAPGRHLLQVSTPHGLTGMWLEIGGDAVVVWPSAGRSVWADGGRSAGGERAMRAMLTDEFGGRQGDVHVIQYRGRRLPMAATFPADGGPRAEWVASAEPKTGTGGGSGGGSAAGGSGSGTGGEAGGGGGGETGGGETGGGETGGGEAPAKVRRFRIAATFGYQLVEPFSYAMLGIDFGVRVWGPLEVGAFVRPSFGGPAQLPDELTDTPVQGQVFLMPFGVSAGVRKDGWLSPWVAGGLQFAYNAHGLRAQPALLGFMVQGGLDLSPGDGPLIIRLEGEIGLLGLHFAARIHAGAGVRF